MFIRLGSKKFNKKAREKELERLELLLNQYYHSEFFNKNPFAYHNECDEINCEKCIQKHIKYLLKKINEEDEIEF